MALDTSGLKPILNTSGLKPAAGKSAAAMPLEQAKGLLEAFPDEEAAPPATLNTTKLKPVLNTAALKPVKESAPAPATEKAATPAPTPAPENDKLAYGKTLKRTAKKYSTDIKEQFTKPFAKDNSPGPEWLQRIGDIGGRVGSVAADFAGLSTSPVEAGIKSKITQPVAEYYKKQGGDPAKLDQMAEDTGDLLNMAAFAPGALKKAKGAADAVDVDRTLAPIAKKAPLRPIEQPQNMADDLFKITNAAKADRIELTNRLKQVESVPNATWEKLYAYEENPKGVVLTPQEKQLYDTVIAPIKVESDQIIARMKKQKVPGVNDIDWESGLTPRQVKGYGTPMDRLSGMKESVGRKSLTRTAGSLKQRALFAAEDGAGKRQIVTVDGGKVYLATPKGRGALVGTLPTKVKNLGNGTRVDVPGGSSLKLMQARTPEIEAATNVRYHKNLLGNRVTSLLQLRRAERNGQLLDNLLKDPEFHKIGFKYKGKQQPPDGWREVNIPQFRGYHFKPEIAEVFEDFAKDARTPEDWATAYEKIGRFTKASIFYNPVPHMRNVWNHLFVGRGLVGGTAGMPRFSKAFYDSARAVMRQDKTYVDYLRSGASLPGADRYARQMQSELMRAMGTAQQQNPQQMSALAKAFGYANPAKMVKGIYDASNKALWSFSDMVAMARIKELEAGGLSRAEAIKKAEFEIPNYRIPSRVAGSRTVSEVMQNPALSLFGRYQYGRMRSYADTVHNLIGKDASLKDRAHALDQLAMMGFLMYVAYPYMDKLVQGETGNEQARVGRPGALAVPQSIADVTTGRKTPAQALQSTFSPGTLSAPFELWFNQQLGTGMPVYQPDDVKEGRLGRVAYDIGKFGLNEIAPIAQAWRMAEGRSGPEEFLLEQAGVQAPSDRQVQGRAKAQKYRKQQAKLAERRRRQDPVYDALGGGE